MGRTMAEADPLEWLLDTTETEREALLSELDAKERREWHWHWGLWRRPSQAPPSGNWQVWMIMAGRGFGKTRTGAQWVQDIAETTPEARIALVAANLPEARAVMVEGESGLLNVGAPWRRATFEPSLRRLTWRNGAQATLYSAAEPESLRGPQHSHACRSGAEGSYCKRSPHTHRSAVAWFDRGRAIISSRGTRSWVVVVGRSGCSTRMVKSIRRTGGME